tara:strand:+ start:2144 stop:2317 length:174 start_codon:yes stop_codon:yes gene_type:complete
MAGAARPATRARQSALVLACVRRSVGYEIRDMVFLQIVFMSDGNLLCSCRSTINIEV